MQTDEAVTVQVVDSFDQLALGEQGEPSQGKDFSHEIEHALKQLDADMEQQELEHDTYLMPHHKEVDSPALMHLEEEQVSDDQGGIEILGDRPGEEMHNISFDESQHRVVQSRIVSTPEDQTYLAQVQERVIVTDVCKHPVSLADATRVYAETTSSSVHFLIVEN